MSEKRTIFVFEPHAGAMKRAVSLIEQLGYSALETATPEQATAALDSNDHAAILIAHNPAGVELCQYAREFTSLRAPLAALVSQNEEDPDAAVVAMEADGFLRRPYTAGALETFLGLGAKLVETRRRMHEIDRATSPRDRSLRPSRTGFHDFDSIKDLLVVEVRRAKRYGYPLAILMVGLDPLPAVEEIKQQPALQREITAGLAVAIAKSIRVIDIPIQYADDRILVFLPHTDFAGAEEVGRRIKRRIKRITYRGEGVTAELTASVGIAGMLVGDNVTFSKLIKDAHAALKAAQLKGGDRVMKRLPPGHTPLPPDRPSTPQT